jgi:hypothetical protein
VTSAIADPAAYPNPATFGMDMPTLRWVNGSSLNDVFVDGMTTAQFLAATGLELHMDKGGYVLSKRLSRVMRPYFASTFLPNATVQIRHLDQDERERKVWDGAGLISRAMLERLVIPPGCSPAKREELLREIQHCQRVEFTVLSERGQDKGHALVADDLEADFVLPRDTKGEVRLGGGRTFIGVNFVHAHDEMRLDIQSLINLHPFFDEAHLMKWLEDEGQLFAQAVETGAVSEAMARIDHHTTLDDIEKWHLREYFASGGHPMWFGNMVRNLMNQHLQRLNHATLEKLRLPVPGGRYYVMPIGVGQRAGVQHDVPRGHIRIDRAHATAWVNDDDWCALEGSDQGIAGILGGADNDDALWTHPFQDHDGEAKVLVWRSPIRQGNTSC